METFVTAVMLLAMVAVGVFLIHRLNTQHDERIAVFPYGRSRSTVRGPAPSAPQKPRGRAGSGAGHRRDGGRGWLRPHRRTRTAGK